MPFLASIKLGEGNYSSNYLVYYIFSCWLLLLLLKYIPGKADLGLFFF